MASLIPSTRAASVIYDESIRLLAQGSLRPVRLIGTGIYHLTGEYGRQLHFDDLLPESAEAQEREVRNNLAEMRNRYGLNFAENLEKVFHGVTLYRTIVYMRKKRKEMNPS